MSSPPVILASLMLASALFACGDPARPLTVRAAASLTDALPEVVAELRRDDLGEIELGFDASSRLARQIEAGAPCDIVITADEEWMDHLAEAGAIRRDSRVDLLGNHLVVVVPRDATTAPRDLAGLAAPEIRRIALAGETVPAGRYADAALASAGLTGAVRDRIARGDTVRSALAWVARGEADAGIVYQTDAIAEPRVRVAFTIPAAMHPEIVYPAAVTAATQNRERADRLLAFLGGDAADAIFERAGFETR